MFMSTRYKKRAEFPLVKKRSIFSADDSLAKLCEFLTNETSATKLITPKYKDFRSQKLKFDEKTRLNNAIWRAWHIQYKQKKKARFLQFAAPFSDETSHSRIHAVLLEGKYWKRRLDTVSGEFKQWRKIHKEKLLKSIGTKEDITQESSDEEHWTSESENESEDKAAKKSHLGANKHSYQHHHHQKSRSAMYAFPDTLFSSLDNNRSQFNFDLNNHAAFKDFSGMLQPTLDHLNPSFDELLDTNFDFLTDTFSNYQHSPGILENQFENSLDSYGQPVQNAVNMQGQTSDIYLQPPHQQQPKGKTIAVTVQSVDQEKDKKFSSSNYQELPPQLQAPNLTAHLKAAMSTRLKKKNSGPNLLQENNARTSKREGSSVSNISSKKLKRIASHERLQEAHSTNKNNSKQINGPKPQQNEASHLDLHNSNPEVHKEHQILNHQEFIENQQHHLHQHFNQHIQQQHNTQHSIQHEQQQQEEYSQQQHLQQMQQQHSLYNLSTSLPKMTKKTSLPILPKFTQAYIPHNPILHKNQQAAILSTHIPKIPIEHNHQAIESGACGIASSQAYVIISGSPSITSVNSPLLKSPSVPQTIQTNVTPITVTRQAPSHQETNILVASDNQLQESVLSQTTDNHNLPSNSKNSSKGIPNPLLSMGSVNEQDLIGLAQLLQNAPTQGTDQTLNYLELLQQQLSLMLKHQQETMQLKQQIQQQTEKILSQKQQETTQKTPTFNAQPHGAQGSLLIEQQQQQKQNYTLTPHIDYSLKQPPQHSASVKQIVPVHFSTYDSGVSIPISAQRHQQHKSIQEKIDNRLGVSNFGVDKDNSSGISFVETNQSSITVVSKVSTPSKIKLKPASIPPTTLDSAIALVTLRHGSLPPETSSDITKKHSPDGKKIYEQNLQLENTESISNNSQQVRSVREIQDRSVYNEHRRQCHLSAEQRRRGLIKHAFEDLGTILHENGIGIANSSRGNKLSNAAILQHTCEFIKQLQSENKAGEERVKQIQQEIENVRSGINECQKRLPTTSGGVVAHQASDTVVKGFYAYCKELIKYDRKSWIFCTIMKPLFDSYNKKVTTKTVDEFVDSVLTWFEANCTLTNMRTIILETLTKLSTSTSALDDSSCLSALAESALLIEDPTDITATAVGVGKMASVNSQPSSENASPVWNFSSRNVAKK